MPKAARTITLGHKRYNPIDETEIEEDLAPVKELAKEFKSSNPDVKEKITGAKLVEDENGKRVLLLTGFKTKEKDRSKRMVKVGGEFDPSNIVSGTRRRKNVNYKSLEEKASKVSSKNSFDKRSKLTEKMNKKKKASSTTKKETEDKENVENQMADEAADEEPTNKKQKEEWTYPLTKRIFNMIEKMGGKPKKVLPKRSYRNEESIPDAINAFISVKWPSNVKFSITKKTVGSNNFGLIKHETFILNDSEVPQWMKENEDYVIIGESECGLLAAKMSEATSDFKVYVIFDATDDEEEKVFKMSLSKYLSNLKKHRVEDEEEEEQVPEKEEQTVASESSVQEEEESTSTPQESQELVEQSLATDEAMDEKVDIMQE